MRVSFRRGLLLATAGALLLVGRPLAQAQQTEGYYQQQQPASYLTEMQELRQRLDAYERELHSMRGHMQRLPSAISDNGLNVWEASLAAETAENGMAEVPIIEKPTYKVNGRIFFDHLMVDQDPTNAAAIGNLSNTTQFDTARIKISGDIYENVDYRLQVAVQETSNTSTVIAKDIYMTVKELPVLGHVRIGHIKEPFSLDQLTSSRFITFMERNVADEFAPARDAGFMAFNEFGCFGDWHWYAGVFRTIINDRPVHKALDSADWSFTGRIAGNPYYDEPSGGRYLMHVGMGYSHREFGGQAQEFDADVGLDISGDLVSFTVAKDTDDRYNFELGMVWGAFHAQAEYFFIDVDQAGAGPDLELNGFYAQMGYFLTGEHRGYKQSSHAFDRTHVISPFFVARTCDGFCRGPGAWEIAYRYGILDMNDSGVLGGRVERHTFGVNWYLNSYMRIMFNYAETTEIALTGGGDGGQTSAFGTRFQVDF